MALIVLDIDIKQVRQLKAVVGSVTSAVLDRDVYLQIRNQLKVIEEERRYKQERSSSVFNTDSRGKEVISGCRTYRSTKEEGEPLLKVDKQYSYVDNNVASEVNSGASCKLKYKGESDYEDGNYFVFEQTGNLAYHKGSIEYVRWFAGMINKLEVMNIHSEIGVTS